MTRKRVLIVSRSFYPENSPRSFRTTELVKEFSRKGHSVTLITLRKEKVHADFEKEYGVEIKDMGPLRWAHFTAKSSVKPIWLAQRAMVMGLKLLFEYPDIELMKRVKGALKKESGYDLMISIAVPHSVHWGVAKARTDNHPIANVWAADCGDPYMGFDKDRFRKPFWFSYLEKEFCRKADYITVPIEGAKDAYYQEFREKIRVIPQGFNFDEIEISSEKDLKYGVPTFGYAGGLWGGGRNPDELLEHLCRVEKPFKFVVHTNNRAPLAPYLTRLNGRLEVYDYIPRKELLKKMAGMDFLINLENDTSKQQPSKLIDYYLAGRPVLSVPSRELNTDTVDSFLNGDYTEQYPFENMDRFRIENVCNQFLDLCNP